LTQYFTHLERVVSERGVDSPDTVKVAGKTK